MADLRLRTAHPDEEDRVNARYDEVDFVASDVEEETVIVAETDGEIVGLGRLVPVGADALELGGIYTDPDHRGRGIATAVVERLLDEADDETLYCVPFSELESFYRRYGFVPYDAPVDDLPDAMQDKWELCRERYDDVELLVRETP